MSPSVNHQSVRSVYDDQGLMRQGGIHNFRVWEPVVSPLAYSCSISVKSDRPCYYCVWASYDDNNTPAGHSGVPSK